LEFASQGESIIPYAQFLDELAETGYEGTELGPWGYLPTDPQALKEELSRRGLGLVGAFLPIALADPKAHAPGEEEALKVAHLLAAAGDDPPSQPQPFLILSDENGRDEIRTKFAGRIRPEHQLPPEGLKVFAEGVERIAQAVREKTGIKTVFHHHCGGFIETPKEIEALLELTDPKLLGLCFDTGHYSYGGGEALEGLKHYGERVWHLHLKDCDPEVAARARREGWDYFEAVRRGLFCELGRGGVDFPAVIRELDRRGYEGWVVVEQDLLPGPGAIEAPKERARRNRDYLRKLGI